LKPGIEIDTGISVQRKLKMKFSNKLNSRVAVASLSSPLEVGADRSVEICQQLVERSEKAGNDVLNLGVIDTPEKAVEAGKKMAENRVDCVVFAVACWFEDYLVLDLLEYCNVPVLLWSVPGMETGALCGSQQLTAYLKQLDVVYCGVYGAIEDSEAFAKYQVFLQSVALKKKLRTARIGFGGYQPVGMTEVTANQMVLKKVIGPRIVPLDMPEILTQAKNINDEVAAGIWKKVVGKSGKCNVSDSAGLDSVKVYLVIKELVDQYKLDALTIGCYPHFMGRVCLASSLLADQGVPLGCEGDVNGVIAQLILTLLTGQATHNADWLEPLDDGTVVLTHCGSGSFSLAENQNAVELNPVRLMNQGVCCMFTAKPGTVTLLNLISQGNGYQMALLKGQALKTGMVFPGNPVRVQFESDVNDIIEWIHKEGIGHHWMIGYGDVSQQVRQWAAIPGKGLSLIEM